jgi:hypothetical protein
VRTRLRYSFPYLGRPSRPQIPTERIFLIVHQWWSSTAGSPWRERVLGRVIHFPTWVALLVHRFLRREFFLLFSSGPAAQLGACGESTLYAVPFIPYLGCPSRPQIPTERIFLIVQQRWSSTAGSTWRDRAVRRVIHFPTWIALLVLRFLLSVGGPTLLLLVFILASKAARDGIFKLF